MANVSTFHQLFAVVRGNNDQGIVQYPEIVESSDPCADQVIKNADLTVVQGADGRLILWEQIHGTCSPPMRGITLGVWKGLEFTRFQFAGHAEGVDDEAGSDNS